MRPILPIAAGCALWVGSAQAATAPQTPTQLHGIGVTFGNTVEALYSDGRYERIWFQANGAWEAVGRRGQRTSGHWTLKSEGKVCMSQARPFPAPFHYCTDFPPDGGLGAVWTSHDWRGEPIRLTVVKGIEKP
jgi:hypothetical protein